MTTCKDCIHEEICDMPIITDGRKNASNCNKFKNKADFVEVVEIERLLEERDKLLKECKKCGRRHGRNVSRLQKEIDKLKNQIKVGDKIYEDTCKKSQGEIDCWRRTCKQAKSEAYREFAELLKATKFTHKNLGELVYVEDIDNTLDELTGGE